SKADDCDGVPRPGRKCIEDRGAQHFAGPAQHLAGWREEEVITESIVSAIDQKIVIVTRPTQLADLRRKFNTRAQAKFQIVTAKRRELARSASAGSAKLEEMAEQ